MKVCCFRKRTGTWIPVTAPDGGILDVSEEIARKKARAISKEGHETAVFFGSGLIARFRDGEEVSR